ncbi:uncharacterized protein LOC123897169 isoform X1 [Trifolium pratense]|uniref:uncharacterized protein LOC123897169 isoform X1 n=1 Tax=Trifolium pratense TaxID=57577 RepID=UPI001E6962B4|nr:uncharacterized protein LOC123897169 isoform X1 [Trifolium pratense]
MDRVLLQESTVEGDDLVDLKSERKHVEIGTRLKLERKHVQRGKRLKITHDRVRDRANLRQAGKLSVWISSILMINERGKRLKLKRKRVEDDLVDMKSERKHVERGKRLKSARKHVERGKRLKSERKHVESGTRLKSEPERKQTGKRYPSPFDVIAAPPPQSFLPGRTARAGSLCPVRITDENRGFLIKLSKLALEKYNDDNNQVLNNGDNNQDPQFEFDELVRSNVGSCAGSKYFITFKAKRSSETSSTIFQAIIVWRSFEGSSQVLSCDIKT